MNEQEIRQRIRSIEDSTDNPEEHRIELEMLYEWLDEIENCSHEWVVEGSEAMCSHCTVYQVF